MLLRVVLRYMMLVGGKKVLTVALNLILCGRPI